MSLEEMSSFFNSRVERYDEHMLKETAAAGRDYAEIAKLIPNKTNLEILDLGCGTGLELDEIFKINPSVRITGIDLADKMLQKLTRKHAARKNQLKLILANYFEYDFGNDLFEIALSAATLHHFTHAEKIGLYKKIVASLKADGFYIESDYMAPSQEYEDFRFAENKRIRAESGITAGFYHYDTPCTVENQIAMLRSAGFRSVEIVWRENIATVLLAKQ